MELEGLKNVKVTAHRSQMTFCASCKSCPAIDISTESDKVIVGGEDEGYTEFTKDQFELFVKTIKDGRIVYQVNIGGKVIEKNQEDIKKLISPKDYTAISNLETQLDLAKQMPSSGYTKYDADGAAYIARNIYNIINKKNNVF